jgi:hypothetical protein
MNSKDGTVVEAQRISEDPKASTIEWLAAQYYLQRSVDLANPARERWIK